MTVGWWAEYRDRFSLNLPINVAVQAGGLGFQAPVGVNVPISIGMDETHSYTEDFGLDIPVSIGLTYTPLATPADFALTLTPPSISTSGRVILPFADYSDDFTRDNNTNTLGPNWTIRNNGIMGIRSNRAYSVRTDGWICAATWNEPMLADNQQVTVAADWSTNSSQPIYIFLGSGIAAQVALEIVGGLLKVYTSNNWMTTKTDRTVNSSAPGLINWDAITFSRTGNVYSASVARVNAGAPTVIWTDNADAHPRGADYRFVGIGCASYGFSGFDPNISAFTAQDL